MTNRILMLDRMRAGMDGLGLADGLQMSPADLRARVAAFDKPTLKVINYDNVSEFYHSQSKSWAIPELRNVRAPFDEMWLESAVPEITKSWSGFEANTKSFSGVYLKQTKFKFRDFQAEGVVNDDFEYLRSIEPEETVLHQIFFPHIMFEGLVKDGQPLPRLVTYMAPCHLLIDYHGTPLSPMICAHPENIPNKAFEQKPAIKIMSAEVFPALLAIKFMNCKNVLVREEKAPPKLSKAFKKRHGTGLTNYGTIVIDPFKEVLRKEGNLERDGLKKALHTVRGHFVTYEPERPLFGRLSGEFWKPAHERGSEEVGVCVRDYQVCSGASK